MIRVAMISFWHVHARDYARQAREHPDTEIVAAWDEIPERGRAQAQALGATFYESLDELLAQPDIDGVIIDTPTNMHLEVMVAAARAGKHIFTEKVVATTLRECNQILAAVEQAGVKLTVSLPRLYHSYTLAIKDILRQKLLGDVTLVRTRLSHNGALPAANNPGGWLPEHFFNAELCGGGALIDLGCHPMYLARLFLGADLPEMVSANFGYVTGREVEDNAVAVLHYANGALGVVEAGFVNRFSPFSIEVHGTEGSLFYGTPDDRLQIRSALPGAGGDTWHQLALPPEQPLAFHQWVGHIQQNTTASENIAMAVDLTALMEAANLSARNKQPVRLDSLAR
ncbi:MAG: Gfo/Idh/MocA family oxidoreductase [Ktedonobacteraceae bacterium]|nr:Gfo/Idh/MocA family oxidoreductase [Ktedonobacteraceae bacterium]